MNIATTHFPMEAVNYSQKKDSVYHSDYINVMPPSEIKVFQKQKAKRHFGVHGYFTRQVWSVVQTYIKTFTQPGDIVLDAYGGSGVTAIESLILGRRAIHVDINPLSKFIVETLLTPVNLDDLERNFNKVIDEFNKYRPKTNKDIDSILHSYDYPKGIRLPKNSDVNLIEELFTPKQLAELTLLRSLIFKTHGNSITQHLLLMFSGLLNKFNRTYHASAGRSAGRGDSGIFRYYRYRIAHDSPQLEITKVFQSRFKKVLAAKLELYDVLQNNTNRYQIIKGSASNLFWIENETIDYIYTDPPYGSKIPYLDLSIMWNAWLNLPVTEQDKEVEAIEGGEAKKSKDDYFAILAGSINEMYRVLKFNRWMSFVFSHNDPSYWHFIVDTAQQAGFEYINATPQRNGQSSFKKRQNPFSVLSGQLILNFRKISNPRRLRPVISVAHIKEVVVKKIRSVIEGKNGATIEEINNSLVILGLESGCLPILSEYFSGLHLNALLNNQFKLGIDGRYVLR